MEEIRNLIADLYKARNSLKKIESNKNERWKFTLDGNLIGDIGEIIACYHFDLEPLSRGEKTHDAKTKDGKYVQIKATQGDEVGLGLEKREFEYLIVIKLYENGKYELIYNGLGSRIWENTNNLSISIKKLKEIDKELKDENRIRIIKEFI